MNILRARPNIYWAAPLLGGVTVLLMSFVMIPKAAELRHALNHRAPNDAPVAVTPGAGIPRPSAPQLQEVLASADAPRISRAVDEVRANGIAVDTAQVVYDLHQLGRFQIAMDFLEIRPDGRAPELWRARFELFRKLGRDEAAHAMIVAAVQPGSIVPARDIVEAAYALDAPEMVLVAAETGTVPPPDAARTLDLARRFEGQGRIDFIARLDAVTEVPWRQSDPWLAIRLARRAGQSQEALRYVPLLPAADREAMREAIVREQGDKAAIRSLLLERASRPDANAAVIAEQLLAAGLRDDAIEVLKRVSATLPPPHKLSRRLLYLMGPRPGPRDVKWLQARTMRGTPAQQREWIDLYMQRDRPQDALAFISRHPLANNLDILMIRLSLARAVGDDDTGARLMTVLLDQPGLDADQVRALSAVAPRKLSTALTRKLTEKRVETGAGNRRDVTDLAWEAWNSGDPQAAAQRLTPYLRENPDDVAALRLMAEVQRRINGDAAARPWRERALAEVPPGTRERAELLESLRRFSEAIAVVDTLLGTRPADKALIAFKARLLLANGQPGRARKVLQP